LLLALGYFFSNSLSAEGEKRPTASVSGDKKKRRKSNALEVRELNWDKA
jgi:hypothetical protein